MTQTYYDKNKEKCRAAARAYYYRLAATPEGRAKLRAWRKACYYRNIEHERARRRERYLRDKAKGVPEYEF